MQTAKEGNHHAYPYRMRPRQGGLPIVVDNDAVGAIGASFDTPEHDVQIAKAGLAAIPH